MPARQLQISRGWPFHEAKNRAVFATTPVLDGTRPILIVSHDKDGDWHFLVVRQIAPRLERLPALEEIVGRHPSVVELADFPGGGLQNFGRRVVISRRRPRKTEAGVLA